MKKFDIIFSVIFLTASLTACSYSSSEKSSDESFFGNVGSSDTNYTNNSATELNSSAEKTEITLGVDEYNFDIADYAAKFNNTDTPYTIVIKDYSDPDKTVTEIQNDMKIDIVAGKSPDMILCTESSFYNILSKKEVFYDVSEIYNNINILPNIRKMCTEENGKIYRIPLGFSVNTAFTSAENGSDCCNIYDYKEMKNTVSKLGGGEVLTYNMMDAEYSIRYSIINDFTDLKNHTCNFDSQEFIEALEFYKYTKLNKYLNDPDATAKIQYLNIGNVPSIASIKHSAFESNEVVMTSPEYARAELNMSLTVSNTADKKAQSGAEEFIKFILSDSCVNTNTPVYFPITESGLDIALALNFDDLDSSGEKIKAGLSEDEMIYYRNYITSVDTENVCDRTVMNIFTEEAESYINGECTAEQCAEYIQNRASLYLSEQE